MGAAVGTVVPILAVICSNIQYSYPLKTALEVRKLNDLGALNPVPWAVLTINCAGWLIYGCIIQDTYLMFSVSFGLPINLFATASALRILGSKKISSRVSEEDFIVNGQAPIDFAKQIELILIGGICLWIFVAFIAGSILPAVLDDPTSTQY
eukprot:gene33414-37760_t